MTKRLSIAGMILGTALLFTACKKNDDVVSPVQPPLDQNTVTPVGTPTGTASHATIGAAGGELTSADGVIKIIIPAGALSADKEIGIQPISNTLPSGIGNAYRLTPHGEQFAVPVSIIVNYKTADLANTLPEFLDIAFQDAQGTWQAMTNSTVDKINKKITVTTKHFSDWSYFKSIQITPQEATVELGDVLWIKVTTTFPFVDPDDAPPGTTTVPVYTNPRPLRPDEILGWSYAGSGELEPDVSKALYTAPNQEPTVNPEAVAVNIKMHRKGQFMLIANITVLSNHGVDYLQVDEDWHSPQNMGKPALYLYGNFGNDPGAGHRSVKINGVQSEIFLWSPTIIAARIDRDVSGAIDISANGHTVASSVLRKFKGRFLYNRFHGGVLNSGNADALREFTEFTLVFRGFGAPCPANITTLFPVDQSLANGTEADFTLTGTASVTTPELCPTTSSVSIPTSSGLQPLNPLSVSGFSIFHAYVKEKAGGIEVKIDFNINPVVTGVVVQRTNCNGTSFDPPKTIGVGFEGFNNKAIDLSFFGTDELVLKNTSELKSGMISSGILIEAWDGTGNPSHYETDGLMRATFKNQP